MALILGIILVVGVLYDAFGTIVLPRSVGRPWRISFFFLKGGWAVIRLLGRRCGRLRTTVLSAFGPAALIALVVFWAALLILGLALVQWGVGSPLAPADESGRFGSYLYLSGTTFLTLGYGDVAPTQGVGRLLAVGEALTGFVFLALIVGYVPVLYGPFARREQTMLRLDARAGSDPTGVELLRRHTECPEALVAFLNDWEVQASALLEAYLSYPILAFYRSQHDDQSWLRSLVAVMDGCALAIVRRNASPAVRFQARTTFAMSRHLLVDLAYILNAPPEGDGRLDEAGYARLRSLLPDLPEAAAPLEGLREGYESFARGLARALELDLPAWTQDEHAPDNWETSAWDGEHF